MAFPRSHFSSVGVVFLSDSWSTTRNMLSTDGTDMTLGLPVTKWGQRTMAGATLILVGKDEIPGLCDCFYVRFHKSEVYFVVLIPEECTKYDATSVFSLPQPMNGPQCRFCPSVLTSSVLQLLLRDKSAVRCRQVVSIRSSSPIKKGFITLFQQDTRMQGLWES